MRALLAVIVATALIAAAPIQKPPKGKSVVIAVAADESVTITLDGKPITCEELNAYFATITTPSQRHGFDCKLLVTKHKP
jgi:hypothetical protein